MGTANDPEKIRQLFIQQDSMKGGSRHNAERDSADFGAFLDALPRFDRHADGKDGPLLQVWEPETPLERAQAVIWEGADARKPGERIRVAREALRISPDCADAYVILGENLAKNPVEALDYFDHGVAAGTRALGPEFVADDSRIHGDLQEARPLLRSLYGRVHAMISLQRNQEAIDTAQRILQLNPADHLEIRLPLMTLLLHAQDTGALLTLAKAFPDEDATLWMFGMTLLKFMTQGGDSIFARRTLSQAHDTNPFVLDYLLDRKPLPAGRVRQHEPGEDSEARWYVGEQQTAWRNVPGAIEWLQRMDPMVRGNWEHFLKEASPFPKGDGPAFMYSQFSGIRWKKCPECQGDTSKVGVHLSVLVEPVFSTAIDVPARYCANCELLIAHLSDVVPTLHRELAGTHAGLVGADFAVFGQIDPDVIGQRPQDDTASDWIAGHTRYFREHRSYTPHWSPQVGFGALEAKPGDDEPDTIEAAGHAGRETGILSTLLHRWRRSD